MSLTRQKLGKIGEGVLMTIGTLGVVTIAVVAPNALSLLGGTFKRKKYSPGQSIKRNIESLLRSGLIKQTHNEGGEKVLEVTKKGKWEIALRHQRIESSEKKKWDERWRVVVFDVPNTKEKVRKELRRGMKLYGFYMLQKSVWVYPYACDDFILLLKSHLGLSSDVLYLTSDYIENDKHLRKYFRI